MKNIVLSIAQVLSKITFYILVVTVFVLLLFLWKSVFLEGTLGFVPKDSVISIISNKLSPERQQELWAFFTQSPLSTTLFALGLSAMGLTLLLPWYWIQQVLNSLSLNNWFVPENTKRLRRLGFYFIGFTVFAILVQLSFLFILKSYSIDFTFSMIYWSILFFLLSYMNQQGVQLSKEAELTV